jgi:cytochrome b561
MSATHGIDTPTRAQTRAQGSEPKALLATERWPTSSVVLHWLAGGSILGLAVVGFVMSDLPPESTARLLLSRIHTLGGAALMLLTVARLVVRWRGPRVAPLQLGELHRKGVGATHAMLYVVTFAIGLSGVVTGALSAWPSYLRGELAEAPALEALASRELHEALVLALLGLIALHVGGVVLQQLRGGRVLRRMLPLLK